MIIQCGYLSKTRRLSLHALRGSMKVLTPKVKRDSETTRKPKTKSFSNSQYKDPSTVPESSNSSSIADYFVAKAASACSTVTLYEDPVEEDIKSDPPAKSLRFKVGRKTVSASDSDLQKKATPAKRKRRVRISYSDSGDESETDLPRAQAAKKPNLVTFSTEESAIIGDTLYEDENDLLAEVFERDAMATDASGKDIQLANDGDGAAPFVPGPKPGVQPPVPPHDGAAHVIGVPARADKAKTRNERLVDGMGISGIPPPTVSNRTLKREMKGALTTATSVKHGHFKVIPELTDGQYEKRRNSHDNESESIDQMVASHQGHANALADNFYCIGRNRFNIHNQAKKTDKALTDVMRNCVRLHGHNTVFASGRAAWSQAVTNILLHLKDDMPTPVLMASEQHMRFEEWSRYEHKGMRNSGSTHYPCPLHKQKKVPLNIIFGTPLRLKDSRRLPKNIRFEVRYGPDTERSQQHINALVSNLRRAFAEETYRIEYPEIKNFWKVEVGGSRKCGIVLYKCIYPGWDTETVKYSAIRNDKRFFRFWPTHRASGRARGMPEHMDGATANLKVQTTYSPSEFGIDPIIYEDEDFDGRMDEASDKERATDDDTDFESVYDAYEASGGDSDPCIVDEVDAWEGPDYSARPSTSGMHEKFAPKPNFAKVTKPNNKRGRSWSTNNYHAEPAGQSFGRGQRGASSFRGHRNQGNRGTGNGRGNNARGQGQRGNYGIPPPK